MADEAVLYTSDHAAIANDTQLRWCLIREDGLSSCPTRAG